MASQYIQNFAKSLRITFLKETHKSIQYFIESLQTSENWDLIFSPTNVIPQDLGSSLQHLQLFRVDAVMDLGNVKDSETRKPNSQLLFILNNKSQTNPVQLKAFEHEPLMQIREDLELEHLINKIVLVSGNTLVVNNTLLINDRDFRVLEVLNESQEKLLAGKLEHVDPSNIDAFLDVMFYRDQFQSMRIFESANPESENPDEESAIEGPFFKNIRH